MGDDAERLERDSYEALVIGSGFGGAVAACRLAQAGLDVAVVERGRRWRPGEFPRDTTRPTDGWWWAAGDGLYDVRPGGGMVAVQAAGYGGGSLVYANIAAHPPHETFRDWPAPYSEGALEPYFHLAAHMLGVSPAPADPRTGAHPPKTRLMQLATERVGRVSGFIHPNLAVTFDAPGARTSVGLPQAGCTFCGECDIGCNVGAKNTLDRTYLSVAEEHGLDVGTRTEALYIGRTADGYRVRIRERGTGPRRRWRQRTIHARYVVLAAGALGSTGLLLRSRDRYGTLPELPTGLGHGYSGNGDFLSFGFDLPDAVEPVAGPTITTASIIGAETRDGPAWFVVEDGGFSPHLAKLVASLDLATLPAQIVRAVRARLDRSPTRWAPVGHDGDSRTRRTAVLLTMGGDSADGRITLRGRRLHIGWNARRNRALYDAESAAAAEIVRSVGGRPANTPLWQLLRTPVTVHNLGGARMATDPADGAVDADGEVFGHPGLFVVDGAALPTSTTGNPSLTIAAVAERCTEALVRRHTGDPGWQAPEWPDVVPTVFPEDAAAELLRAEGLRPPARRGLVFREVMAGIVDGCRTVVRLTVWIADLEAFLNDPDHRAVVTGSGFVEGYTHQPVPVVDGSARLLAHADGRNRSMDYDLPVTDSMGQRWRLLGHKDVSPRSGNPWRATTTLATTLQAEDGAGNLPEFDERRWTGTLHITPIGAARLALSMRATGLPPGGRAATLARSVGAAARFGLFFTRGAVGPFVRGSR